ncbi:uncharacterized protein LTR77_007889 [Saxophila tyrrhenica]|uniref:Major facilitator superfamily (MFS) profile domain-containing protein n=1 Tax=Saxophila tyrrhenica TaxID=1690608 RepID=A0AAV9P3D2_9PEZI|nr:hypothetical protein LTR77_007889 [Saxophila tyrrhenica]
MGKILDNVKFLCIAGVGLFGDGWLNITIGLVIPMIGYLYFTDDGGAVPTVSGSVIKGGLSIGMILGQLSFGLFGDALGRHKVYGKELIITIFGTLLLIVPPTYLGHAGIVAWLTTFRIITGVGIGGDYPMSSSLSAEHNPMGSRAKLILTVFSFLGLGSVSAGVTYIILLAAFREAIKSNIHHLQWVWRLLFGIGLVPLIATLYARLTMKESKPYEKYVSTDTGLIGEDKRGLKEQFADFRIYFSQWKHAKTDIAFYGINLNQSIILGAIGYGTGATPYETLWNTAIGNIIVAAAGYLPGFYIGIFLPDVVGRVSQQAICSALVTLLYAIWAGVTNHTSTAGLMILFTLSQLVLNSGPNCTTFLLPVEVFPTRVRGCAHGIAAASGKAGAVLTAFAFGTVAEKIGINGVLGLFSGIMALCTLVTLLIPEPRGKTLDEIERGALYGEVASPSDTSVSSGELGRVAVHAKGDDGVKDQV